MKPGPLLPLPTTYAYNIKIRYWRDHFTTHIFTTHLLMTYRSKAVVSRVISEAVSRGLSFNRNNTKIALSS